KQRFARTDEDFEQGGTGLSTSFHPVLLFFHKSSLVLEPSQQTEQCPAAKFQSRFCQNEEQGGGEGEAIPGEGSQALAQQKFDEESYRDGCGDGCDGDADENALPPENFDDEGAAFQAFVNGGGAQGQESKQKTKARRGSGRQPDQVAAD